MRVGQDQIAANSHLQQLNVPTKHNAAQVCAFVNMSVGEVSSGVELGMFQVKQTLNVKIPKASVSGKHLDSVKSPIQVDGCAFQVKTFLEGRVLQDEMTLEGSIGKIGGVLELAVDE